MRSGVNQILAFNQNFERAALQKKLERMTASPFTFFRATFHLFAYDLQEGWYRDWTLADVEGPIVGDLHAENFGAYRAITGDRGAGLILAAAVAHEDSELSITDGRITSLPHAQRPDSTILK